MRSVAPLLMGITLLAHGAGAEVMVRVASDEVDVDASAAPLSDVLDRLARQTGMELVYEGTPPRQRVTLALSGRTPTEAVLAILEGQGLNYALVADPTGSKVQTLIIAGPAGTGTSTGASSSQASRARSRPRRPRMPPPAASPEMMDPTFDDLEDEDPFMEEEDPSIPGDDFALEPELPEDAGALPAGEAPVPAAGPLPFPGGQQIFPASPFTPQPTYPQPVAPRPPGAGPDQGANEPAAPPP